MDKIKEHIKFASYFPFIGWMFPLSVTPEDRDTIYHVKRAIVMAAFFTAVLIGLHFLSMTIPSSLKGINIAFVVIMYALELWYLAFCILGTLHIHKGEKKDLPVFGVYAERIDI